ncbi:predicted protein [Sparassis crispa]|uniref:Uncharacterized protein n=1 Tax=Sparassis crispa TaxID=139825 RepID=A0A401H3D3_9APHY|nr:predicted protein [Sparassis crispa]GBE88938.1 predicted protein [Sparassis crispa]
MDDIPLISANLASVPLVSLFYGIFLIFFCTSSYLMVRRQAWLNVGSSRPKPIYKTPLFIAGILLFITVTGHWILLVYRSFRAFVYFDGGASPLEFYMDVGAVTAVIELVFFVSTMTIEDAVIVYRLWVIWKHNNYIMIIPVCSFVVNVACYVIVVYQYAHYHMGQNVFGASIGRWVTIDYVCSLCTNLYCCVLIVWRLWRVSHRSKPVVGTCMLWTLSVFIESAAFDVALMIVAMVLYELRLNVYTVADMMSPLSGITFMLINIRVGMGYAMHSQEQAHHVPCVLLLRACPGGIMFCSACAAGRQSPCPRQRGSRDRAARRGVDSVCGECPCSDERGNGKGNMVVCSLC